MTVPGAFKTIELRNCCARPSGRRMVELEKNLRDSSSDSHIFFATRRKSMPFRRIQSVSARLSHPMQYLVFGLVTLALASFRVHSTIAEEKLSECASVKIYVRTIKASEPIDERSFDGDASGMEIDQDLKDLTSKLEKLPFRSFTLLASREEELRLRKKETLNLPNGQTLTFRPVYLDNKRVGISLDWKDRDGAGILNTRVHFDPEESLLTGTDSGTELEAQGGLILAIRAVPIPNSKVDVVPAAAQTP